MEGGGGGPTICGFKNSVNGDLEHLPKREDHQNRERGKSKNS